MVERGRWDFEAADMTSDSTGRTSGGYRLTDKGGGPKSLTIIRRNWLPKDIDKELKQGSPRINDILTVGSSPSSSSSFSSFPSIFPSLGREKKHEDFTDPMIYVNSSTGIVPCLPSITTAPLGATDMS